MIMCSAGMPAYIPCLQGTYSSSTGALSSATCQKCGTGQYATALGASSSVSCQSCPAGSHYNWNGVDLSSCVFATEFTWLYKNLSTGFYYLNMPNTSSSTWNYYGAPISTYWSKVRINSTLSQSINRIQLYVGFVGNSESPCLGTTIDTTYAIVPQTRSWFADFASADDCGFIYASTRLYLEGSPFSIVEQTGGWVATDVCNYASTMSVSCRSSQDCTVGIVGDCGSADFKGLLGVFNVEKFLTDVQLACALYKDDPNLSCLGNETLCSNPCSICAVGTYSSAPGLTTCQVCSAGSFSNTTGISWRDVFYLERICSLWLP